MSEERTYWVSIDENVVSKTKDEVQALVNEGKVDYPVMASDEKEWKKALDYGILSDIAAQAPAPVSPKAPLAPVPTPVADYVQTAEEVAKSAPAPVPVPAPQAQPPVAAAPPWVAAGVSQPALAPAQAPAGQPPVPAPVPATSAPGGVPSFIQGTGVEQDMNSGKASSGGGNKRFWMPKGSSKVVIFLSDGTGPLPYGPPKIAEHNPPIGQGKQRWQHWHSCLEPVLGKGACPLCNWETTHNGVGRAYFGLFFTIVDTTEFEDASGQKRSNVKRLLCAKKDTAELITRKYVSRIESSDTLRGAMFRVFRGNGDKTPSVGDDYEFMQMVDLSTLPDSEPFDYAEMLAPNLGLAEQAVQRMAVEAGEAAPGAVGAPPVAGATGPAVSYS